MFLSTPPSIIGNALGVPPLPSTTFVLMLWPRSNHQRLRLPLPITLIGLSFRRYKPNILPCYWLLWNSTWQPKVHEIHQGWPKVLLSHFHIDSWLHQNTSYVPLVLCPKYPNLGNLLFHLLLLRGSQHKKSDSALPLVVFLATYYRSNSANEINHLDNLLLKASFSNKYFKRSILVTIHTIHTSKGPFLWSYSLDFNYVDFHNLYQLRTIPIKLFNFHTILI